MYEQRNIIVMFSCPGCKDETTQSLASLIENKHEWGYFCDHCDKRPTLLVQDVFFAQPEPGFKN